MGEPFKRYCIYFIPPDGHSLEAAGTAWFGRSIVNRNRYPTPTGEFANWIKTPAKYGFHGTLKAPFRLADGHSLEDLKHSLSILSGQITAFPMPPLQITHLGSFLALTESQHSTELRDLAERVVEALDIHRAPLTPAELARRNPEQLTDEQRHNLMHWGYPYTHKQFRFHMTLTGNLPLKERVTALKYAEIIFHVALKKPLPFSEIALCGEHTETGLFYLIERFKLQDADPA